MRELLDKLEEAFKEKENIISSQKTMMANLQLDVANAKKEIVRLNALLTEANSKVSKINKLMREVGRE